MNTWLHHIICLTRVSTLPSVYSDLTTTFSKSNFLICTKSWNPFFPVEKNFRVVSASFLLQKNYLRWNLAKFYMRIRNFWDFEASALYTLTHRPMLTSLPNHIIFPDMISIFCKRVTNTWKFNNRSTS